MTSERPTASQMRAVGMAVSTAAWDGYDWPEVFASMARLGIGDIELAFIKGYVSEFGDGDLDEALADELLSLMARHGQRCTVLSAHLDPGAPGGIESMAVRIRFARALGATYLITNAADVATSERFEAGLSDMMASARQAGVKLLFENPGNGGDNLINRAADLPALLARLDRSAAGINYDPGNLISHRPALPPVADALEAIALSDHLHLKAVGRDARGYGFGALGTGDIDYAPIVAALARRGLPFSLELPFRLRRDANAQPVKRDDPLSLVEIERGVSASLEWMARHHPGLLDPASGSAASRPRH